MNKKKQLLCCGALLVAGLCLGSALLWKVSDWSFGCKETDFSPWTAVETMQTVGQENPQEKRVFLTFDDGPSSTTEQILKVLKEKDVKATFFVVGAENNEPHFPLLETMQQEGHAVALHSYSHEYSKIYSSTAAYWEDIQQLIEKISPYLHQNPTWLRFPGGSSNTVSRKYGGSGLMEKLTQQAEEKGYHSLDWNVSAEDAVGKRKSPDTILQNIIKESKGKNTCVVLMHDTKATKSTAEALPAIIDWYKEQGYRFCTVEQENP